MNTPFLTTDQQLAEFCDELVESPQIAFDTEFVSEFTYRAQLCLLQVATPRGVTLVDTIKIEDMSRFWRVMVDGDHETIVHAGREELGFCWDATGKFPKRVIDVQIAAGLIGLEFPASYGTLLYKLIGKRLHKAETRTDWRRRPLNAKQLQYAVDDVLHLIPLRDELVGRLEKLGRRDWLLDEVADWQQEISDYRTNERWRRVSGCHGLPLRSLAIVRELWRWRKKEAESKNIPPRKILRDDLLVELAKRQSADEKQVGVVRGMEYHNVRKAVPAIAEVIGKALELPDDDCPKYEHRDGGAKLTLVSQFLGAALGSICRGADVAPSLVGAASDVRDLVAFHLGQWNGQEEQPTLAKGWRATVVGKVLEDLLEGRLSIRIQEPLSEHPLVFEPSERTAASEKPAAKKGKAAKE